VTTWSNREDHLSVTLSCVLPAAGLKSGSLRAHLHVVVVRTHCTGLHKSATTLEATMLKLKMRMQMTRHERVEQSIRAFGP
jgi:hypothetical protein